jgi:integrase/recombinase XerC
MTNKEFWINSMRAEQKSEKTMMAYVKDVDNFFSCVGKEDVDITVADINMWKMQLSGLAPASINRKIAAVKNYFDCLFDNEIIEHNPVTRIKQVKNPAREQSYVEYDKAKNMLNHCKNARDKAIIAVYLTTGIRVSELINLKLDDYINDSAVITTKGNKQRRIYFNDDCRACVDEYIKTRKDSVYDNLFISNQGNPMAAHNINSMLKVTARRSGLNENISNHTLRRSAVTQVCENYGIAAACAWVGHSNITTTQRYVRTTQNQIANIAANMSL